MATYILIRHALPILAKKGQHDKLRPIGPDGILQAKKCALHLKSNNSFDLAITSSALRAKGTLEVILRRLKQMPKIIEFDSIYQPPDIDDQVELDNMLNQIGKMPLTSYMEKDKNSSWARYDKRAIFDVARVLRKYKPNRVLIVGHGNIINSIGLSLAPTAIKLKDIYFNYCEGFELSNGKLTRTF